VNAVRLHVTGIVQGAITSRRQRSTHRCTTSRRVASGWSFVAHHTPSDRTTTQHTSRL